MRLRHSDGTIVHIAYRVNVHAAADVDDVISQVGRHVAPTDDRLALGLGLAADVIDGLTENPAALRRLRTELAMRGLDVVTMNVDWTDPRRLVSCAHLLAELLPDNAVRGSIATMPPAARYALDNLADGLAELHWSTGRRIRVGLNAIATTEQAIAELSTVDNEWIGVSLDAGQLAVDRLTAACVPIVKVTASFALHADDTLTALFGPGGARTDHVEVTTDATELAWTRDRLVAMGLKEQESA
jgi:hypothetical protein